MLDYQMWDILVNYSSKAKETPQGSLKSPGCINIFRDLAVGQKTQQRQPAIIGVFHQRYCEKLLCLQSLLTLQLINIKSYLCSPLAKSWG